jgi:hypothetical protein
MKRKNKKVTCYNCGEEIDFDLATSTDEGYLCEECYRQLEEEEECDNGNEEELDFFDDSDSEEDEDYEELDFRDNGYDDD